MSIESEITRLVEAKQVLENWLIKQNVAVPNDALLGDLVKLLNAVQTSSGSAEVASVTLSKGTGVSVSSCYIFSGGSLASKSSTATTLPCAVGDLNCSPSQGQNKVTHSASMDSCRLRTPPGEITSTGEIEQRFRLD